MEQAQSVPVIPPADFCMVMTGESMAASGIYDGDIVGLAACDHPEDGAIVAVQVNGETLLRLVVGNGTTLADNPKRDTTSVVFLSELPGAKIVGRVVEIRRIIPPVGNTTEEGEK